MEEAGGRRCCLSSAEGTVRGGRGQRGPEGLPDLQGHRNRAQSSWDTGQGGTPGRACPSTCPTSLSDLVASSSAHLPWGTSFQNTCYCLVRLEAPSPTLCTTGSVEWLLMSCALFDWSIRQMSRLRLQGVPSGNSAEQYCSAGGWLRSQTGDCAAQELRAIREKSLWSLPTSPRTSGQGAEWLRT